jgi:seryl-tRNA(Sec) selenium transferase
MASRLRSCETPVIGRIQEDRFLIDPRTLINDDEELLLHSLNQAFGLE